MSNNTKDNCSRQFFYLFFDNLTYKIYNKAMNKEIIEKWLEYALADLDVAKRLFVSKKPTQWTYLLILRHCHQAIEKTLKMVGIKHNKEIPKIHDLPRLVHLFEINLKISDKTFIKDLNPFFMQSRYPDLLYPPLSNPDKTLTKKYLDKTDKLILWLKKQ
jgi:HEPN domain-containing protein